MSMKNNVDVLEIYVRNRLEKRLRYKNEAPYAAEGSIYQSHVTRGIYMNLLMGSDKALKGILLKDIPREVGVYDVINRIVNKVINEMQVKLNINVYTHKFSGVINDEHKLDITRFSRHIIMSKLKRRNDNEGYQIYR